MKMFLLFLFIFPFTLLHALDDVEIQNSYEQGLQYYKEKDFKKSYSLFSEIYLHKLSDMNFNFFLGRSAYETGHYNIALAAFERVDIGDSSNLRNKLEMARTYYMLKMYEDSEAAFEEVLANQDIPKNIRTNIELALSRVSKVQQKSFTYARVMLEMLYDSNVNYGSIDDYQYGGINLTKVDEISDIALQAYGDVVNIYDIGDKNGFAIKNNFSLYYKKYSEEDGYNLLYLAYKPSLIYKETKYTAEILLGMDTMILGEDKYLSSIYLMPRVEYSHTPTVRSLAHFKYQAKMFEQDAQKDLDASRYELVYGLQDILTPRSYIQANIMGVVEKKDGGDNIYVDFNEVKLNATYVNQFTSKFTLDAFLQARQRNYADESTGFDSTRSDTGGLGSIGLSMRFYSTFTLKLKTSYEYVDSNQERFTYQKYTATAGITKTF